MTISDEFNKDLQSVLNKHSKENASGTPDFVLADFLQGSLEMFNDAVQKRGSWRGEPVTFKPVPKKEFSKDDLEEKSPYKTITDMLAQQQTEARERILKGLMEDPGFLSTYGPDFVVDWDPVEFFTEHGPTSSTLDSFKVKIRQSAVFYTAEAYEKKNGDAELEELRAKLSGEQLRQNPDGNLESV